ncbi:collagen alpha-2(IV) chain [Drosophila biarmipes]|uniref:collagen alpha-2(IV) chain n=1 Tax=Drosophila biarmipes TaxID=125945 RepID=UPI0007E75905|nr:collagen alpha-2(IV) chain [Drosophila biarmipes]
MTKFVAKKALLLLSLLLLGTAQAGSLDKDLDQHVRKERQMKMAASTDPDVKMVANVTPTTASQPMQMTMGMALPMNQMALSSVGGQLVRYPNYPGLVYPGIGPQPGLNGIPGLQTNIANNYPSYPDPNLAGSAPGFNPFGSFGYPGVPPMYGSPTLPYPNPQLPNGFVPNPAVDNYQSLNNIVNMANAQGLGGGSSALYPAPQGFGGVSSGLPFNPSQGFGGPSSGIYPAPQVNMQGLYPPAGGFLGGMNMQAYAPGF